MFPKSSHDPYVSRLRVCVPLQGYVPKMEKLAQIVTLFALTFTSSFPSIIHVDRYILIGSW